MGYEYEEINRAIVQQNGIDNNINRGNLLREIDEVYAQATKADEYEAKAKAFDEIFKLYVGYEDGWIHFPRGSKSFNKEIINVCKYYESGERNAKK